MLIVAVCRAGSDDEDQEGPQQSTSMAAPNDDSAAARAGQALVAADAREDAGTSGEAVLAASPTFTPPASPEQLL